MKSIMTLKIFNSSSQTQLLGSLDLFCTLSQNSGKYLPAYLKITVRFLFSHKKEDFTSELDLKTLNLESWKNFNLIWIG